MEENEVVESTTEENEERGLTVQKPTMYNMAMDLFNDEPKTKKICRLDLNDEENAILSMRVVEDDKIIDNNLKITIINMRVFVMLR